MFPQMARTNKYKNKTYVKLFSDGFQYVHLWKYVAISLELVQGCCILVSSIQSNPLLFVQFFVQHWNIT
jgi:hypothetical protein